MNNILLIWEEVPENTTIYYFGNLNEEEYGMIMEANNGIVNTVSENEEQQKRIEAAEYLSDWLTDKEKYKVNLPFKISESVTVILSGCML